MFKPKQLRKLIYETLRCAGGFDVGVLRFIEVTFLIESDLEVIYSDSRIDKRGLSQIDERRFDEILNTYLRPSRKAREAFSDVCLVDLDTDSNEDLFEAQTYNLAFQILFLAYYLSENGLEDILDTEKAVELYLEHWKSDFTEESKRNVLKRFLEYDKEARRG